MVRCSLCGEEVKKCAYCGRDLTRFDEIIHLEAIEGSYYTSPYHHFCDEECLAEFLLDNSTYDWVEIEGDEDEV